jgi:indole-3-glycerol phosphate synthase
MRSPPDILSKIISAKKKRLEPLLSYSSKVRKKCEKAPPPLDFFSALSGDGLSVISEIKKTSPSAGTISSNFDPAKIAENYFSSGSDALSVLTEEDFFSGSTRDLEKARRMCPTIPILRKDFIFNEFQIYEARAVGADSFLLICSILEEDELKRLIYLGRMLGMEALVETHDESEIENAVSAGAKIIGVNNRNLRTFGVDISISARLAPLIPKGVLKVSESGIKTIDDARRIGDAGYDAVLIGETLMRSDSVGSENIIRQIKCLMKKSICLAFLAILAGSLFSCAVEDSQGIARKPPTDAKNFPPVKNVSAGIECVSPRRTFSSGEEIKLIFRLTNYSDKKLIIYEWMRDAGANLRLLWVLCERDEKAPALLSWHSFAPVLEHPIRRQTLELNNRNSTLIEKTFSLKDLSGSADFSNKELYIVGELNIKSVKLRSEQIKIEIKNE